MSHDRVIASSHAAVWSVKASPYARRVSSKAVPGPSASAARVASSRSATSTRFASTCPVTSVNGRPWPASASRVSSTSTRSSDPRNSPTGSGVCPSSKNGDTRPSRWSPEISSRRSGWCRQTCEGAWPGVSITCQSPRSVETTTPGTSSRSTTSSPEIPLPIERRRSAQRRSGSSGTPDWRATSSRRAVVSSGVSSLACRCPQAGCIQTSDPVRSRSFGACPQWSKWAWVQTMSRMWSTLRRAWSSARSRCAIEPGWCIPVSTSTTPSPAASAHALQCGTPGQGSGRRSRQTPGSTRSPRPTSRWRVGLRTAQDGNVRTMGKRSRRRGAETLKAPESEYRSAGGDVLALRGAMTPATRSEYAVVMGGSPLSQEDAWQRGVEFLFERLAVRWEIAGTEPIERQKELLARYRFATQDERRWIRDVLREHLAEWFPDVEAP